MSMSISVNITGDELTIDRLANLGDQLTNFDSALDDIGEEMTSFFSGQVYASQGAELDDQWQPLSAAYELQKAKKYPGRGILIASGEMQNSYFHESDSNSLVVSNSSDHFPYHQSDEPRTTNLPRRASMAVVPQVKQIIAQVIDDDIDKKITSSGLLYG